MITDSAAGHLARVRLATDGDELRQRLLAEVTARIGESLRRERAEKAAEELAAMAAESEASAVAAAQSVGQMERRLVDERRELELRISDAEQRLVAEQKSHARTRASLADARENSDSATLAHARELAAAREESERLRDELQSLQCAALGPCATAGGRRLLGAVR